ncbi:copper amine oxidase N-terminal domain-containing protein, partial [Flavonifractor sp. An92]|uniref:copper amine oxidase N-terminal domain-containing protein n=1 Tax=Flavonifractor sp. An92 TaxID=1965666 RepID=UPI001179C35C
MKRTCLFLFLLFALFSALAVTAQAAGPAGTLSVRFYNETTGAYSGETTTDRVLLTLNGEDLVPDGVPALIQYVNGDGRTLVPVRLVSEALDAEVLWVAETRQVIVLKDSDTIVLTLGSSKATINGVTTDLPGGVPAGAVKYNGLESTMVPLRFVSEALGADVGWDNDTFTASITTQAVTPTPTPTPTP